MAIILANSYPKTFKQKENFFGLTVFFVMTGHLQLKELINPKILFENTYMCQEHRSIVFTFVMIFSKVIKKFKLNKDSNILDIACNDGTFF